MDTLERSELLKRLAGAVDLRFPDDLAFFIEREVIDFFERREREPQSPLYDVAGAFEAQGKQVHDVRYGADGTSIEVDYSEPG